MNRKEIEKIERRIGYPFKNKDLLQQAFVRRSYSRENGGGDNEVLEFIGDTVLDYVIVKLLVELFGFIDNKDGDYNEFFCDYDESKLTNIKRKLVEKETLAYRIDLLGFAEYLILGKGDIKNEVYKTLSVKEDLFEAIIGAVAIDSKWNIKDLEEAIENMLDPLYYISDKTEWQCVTLIQEWARKKYNTTADFVCHSSYENPVMLKRANWIQNPKTGSAKYDCLIIVDGFDSEFRGFGESPNEARLDAARVAYDYLKKNGLFFSIRDEIEQSSKEKAINQLETLARRGYFEIPEYKFTETHDKDGNPIWQATCIIEDFEKVFNAASSSKKNAKKEAALEMLNYVLENYEED
ncbi:MAG: hypothetical protein IJT79_01165 [Ruminococcus sp.]|nr:hypothetical protein [Ruminococcus sp.]